MAEVKWIKIVTNIFDNRKIKQIEKLPEADAIIVIWVKLLCLAGELNENGLIMITREVPYTDEMLANAFNKPINIIRLALEVFQKFNMIEIINNIYCISNWEKYQNIDGLEKIREQTRKRVAKYREKQKILILDSGNVTSNATVTVGNETEKEIDKEIDININNNNEQKQVLLDHFEKIWEVYPNKKGKAKAEEYFLKYVTTGRKINGKNTKLTDIQIWNAVCKYKNECKKNRIEQQFIKHGDTFFNKAIIDYIESENEIKKEEEYKEVNMTVEEYFNKPDRRGKRYV